jgi:hypothetical protein
VHFRAGKNIRSSTVRALLRAADCILQSMEGQSGADLGLSHDEPLDSFRIEAEGVQVIPVGKTNFLETRIVSQLRGNAGGE